MKFKNRTKRVADIPEKLGVASLAIGVFQNMQRGLWMGIGFLAVSILLTTEDN
jgi:tetrahydromethanopterin S-methyltransferase subunit B